MITIEQLTGGSNTHILFNNNGQIDGDATLTFDIATGITQLQDKASPGLLRIFSSTLGTGNKGNIRFELPNENQPQIEWYAGITLVGDLHMNVDTGQLNIQTDGNFNIDTKAGGISKFIVNSSGQIVAQRATTHYYGAPSGGAVHSKVFMDVSADGLSTVGSVSAFVKKTQIVFDTTNEIIYIDAPGGFKIRDTLSGGTTIFDLTAAGAMTVPGYISSDTGYRIASTLVGTSVWGQFYSADNEVEHFNFGIDGSGAAQGTQLSFLSKMPTADAQWGYGNTKGVAFLSRGDSHANGANVFILTYSEGDGGFNEFLKLTPTSSITGTLELNASAVDMDVIIRGDTDTDLVYVDAGNDRVGIGIAAPTAKMHVDQTNSAGAVPVLTLDQADVSEEFMKFVGTAAAATLTQSIVDDGDVTTSTLAAWLKIYVQDDGNQITDQAYFVPIYTLV